MIQLAFSEADKQALHYERYHHPHPRVQQRMEALWLKSQGVPHHQIAQLCAISANTLRSYLKVAQWCFDDPHMQESNILLFFKQLVVNYGR